MFYKLFGLVCLAVIAVNKCTKAYLDFDPGKPERREIIVNAEGNSISEYLVCYASYVENVEKITWQINGRENSHYHVQDNCPKSAKFCGSKLLATYKNNTMDVFECQVWGKDGKVKFSKTFNVTWLHDRGWKLWIFGGIMSVAILTLVICLFLRYKSERSPGEIKNVMSPFVDDVKIEAGPSALQMQNVIAPLNEDVEISKNELKISNV